MSRPPPRAGLLAAFALALALASVVAARGERDVGYDVVEVGVGHPTAGVLPVDADDDGDVDLLVVGGGSVTVLVGDGAGRFEIGPSVEAGEHPVAVARGDLDGDGRADLVVANHETDYVTLLFEGPDGPGSGGRARLPVDVSPHPHAVALADLDEDGHLDLLVDDRDRERIRVFLGAGDGTFRPGTPVDVGGDPYRGMALADVNGDGHVDLVAPLPHQVAVMTGDGRGRFEAGAVLDARAAPPFSVAAADLDGDGRVDIAAGSGEGRGRVTLWWGDGTGAFAPAAGERVAIASGPTALAVGDADGDGTADLLVTSYVGQEAAVVTGRREPHVTRLALGGAPWGIASADVDGDGVLDLIASNDGGPALFLLLGRPPSTGREAPR